MSRFDVVIRGGLVIDGTGAPPRRADVAIADGRIMDVGSFPDDGPTQIDADGLAVAPGVIDIHTHYDAQLCWDGAATPSSLHGVTTVIGGNCGFSLAPISQHDATYMMAMLARVEGMPLAALERAVPWDWTSFGDYLARIEGGLAVNAGFLVGHTALRRAVMGADDARTATSAEIDRMESLLQRSLDQGGLGFSSSSASSHNDDAGRPVSSRFASRQEILRLAGTVRAFEGTTLEFIPSVATEFTKDDVELMTAMSVAANRPLNWNVLNVNTTLRDGVQQRLGASDHASRHGGRVVALTMPISSTLRLNFVSGFILDTFDGWTDLFGLSPAERRSQLGSPDRRARMRRGVEACDSTLTRRLRDWPSLIIGQTFTRATHAHEGRTLGEIVAAQGGDAFEWLLDIVMADDLRTVIVVPPVGNDEESWRLRADVWRDPRVVIGGSDAGAHLDMIDTFTYATAFLGPIVRDGRISLENAVRALTDVPARLYGLRGRGRIETGWIADLVVFDPKVVGPGPVHVRSDLPAGASRLYAEARGIEHVFVRGLEIARQGELTGACPGTVLRAGRDTETVLAAASPLPGV